MAGAIPVPGSTWEILTDDEERAWIPTPEGRFLPMHLTPDKVTIDLIARGLGATTRYGGHTRYGFYSSAEHSVHVCRVACREWCERHGTLGTTGREFALKALLHDAPEGLGFVDLSRPIKYAPGMERYREMSEAAHRAVWDHFGLAMDGDYAIPSLIDEIDKRLVINEVRDLIGMDEFIARRRARGKEAIPDYRITPPLMPPFATASFLHLFHAIKNGDPVNA